VMHRLARSSEVAVGLLSLRYRLGVASTLVT
jgi:hypothetical protein